ncbi:MAG: hypothetical protein J6S63_04220 [Atopobiaceae bacterium]|nr:hypothetical protein [Atopobiaceae bacterium]
MKHRRLTWLASLVAIFALVCGLGLAGCSAGGTQGTASNDESYATADDSANEQVDNVASDENQASDEQTQPLQEDESDAREDQADATQGDQSGGAAEDVAAPENDAAPEGSAAAEDVAPALDEAGTYTSKDEVAWYLHTYGHLPSNYVTKSEAEDAGWKTQGLSLWEACPGKSIGGDRFGNREGKLPKAKGRTWYECDIDYDGARSRNAKRIVYSSDGLIYYTEDHYRTFEQLY